MARGQDTAARSQRLIALATVGALAFATAFAFGRIFVGQLATWKLIAAALISVAISALTERRGLFVATVLSAAGLVVVLAWLVFPQTAWYGLPTMRTLRAVGRSLEWVGQQARVQIAPTPPLAPLMLASVTAVWTAMFAAYALAVRAGSPLLAILPSVALVGFADLVLEDGVRPLYAVVFLVAVLAVVFADGLRRIRQWGPLWAPPFRQRPFSSATAKGVRRVALLAVLAALLIPGILPGFRSAALVDLSDTAGTGARIDPFVSIKSSLERDEKIELFQVTTDGGAAYWRLFALDRFDGETWSLSDPTLAIAPAVPDSTVLWGPLEGMGGQTLTQSYQVLTDLPDRWVPMAYPPDTLDFPDAWVRYDAELGAARSTNVLEEGLEYQVTSRIAQPTPEELDRVSFDAPSEYGQDTFLPGSVSPRVLKIAENWTKAEPTPYRKVFAIQQRLRSSPFAYSTNVEPTADSDALLTFLTQTRVGFCQQFSTAMAVLVRELGYPARVVVGFRPGERDGDTFTVASTDAHSWVEVRFPGYGWLAFEPTPGRSNPISAEPGTYLNPVAPTPGEDGAGAETGPGATGTGEQIDPLTGMGLHQRREDRRREFIGDLPTTTVEDPKSYRIPYGLLLRIVLLIAAVLVVLVPLVKALWRRRILRHSREPRQLVLAAYRVFDGEATDLGLGRAEGETLAEYRERLEATVAFSNGHLRTLTATAVRAAYSADPPRRDEALEAARAANTAIRDMRRSAGFVRRVRGIYRPGL